MNWAMPIDEQNWKVEFFWQMYKYSTGLPLDIYCQTNI